MSWLTEQRESGHPTNGGPPMHRTRLSHPPKVAENGQKSALNCGIFLAKKWPICGRKWPKFGKNWPDFGKILAKIWQKSGKKWPILSRMGELLKGSFFGRFWGPPGGLPGGAKTGKNACRQGFVLPGHLGPPLGAPIGGPGGSSWGLWGGRKRPPRHRKTRGLGWAEPPQDQREKVGVWSGRSPPSTCLYQYYGKKGQKS